METLIAPSGYTNTIYCMIQGIEFYTAIVITIGLILMTIYENRD